MQQHQMHPQGAVSEPYLAHNHRKPQLGRHSEMTEYPEGSEENGTLLRSGVQSRDRLRSWCTS